MASPNPEAQRLLAEFDNIRVIVCPRCQGRGQLVDLMHLTCSDCRGAGKTTTVVAPGTEWFFPHADRPSMDRIGLPPEEAA